MIEEVGKASFHEVTLNVLMGYQPLKLHGFGFVKLTTSCRLPQIGDVVTWREETLPGHAFFCDDHVLRTEHVGFYALQYTSLMPVRSEM